MDVTVYYSNIYNALNAQCSFGTTWYTNLTVAGIFLFCFNDVSYSPSLIATGVVNSSSVVAPTVAVTCDGANGFNQWCEGTIIVQLTNEAIVEHETCSNSTVMMPPCQVYSCPVNWSTF